jgi:hypothetical protein
VPALACTTEVSSSYPFPPLAPVLKDHADHCSCSFQVNTIVTVPALACTTETIARALSSRSFSCTLPLLLPQQSFIITLSILRFATHVVFPDGVKLMVDDNYELLELVLRLRALGPPLRSDARLYPASGLHLHADYS